MDRDTIAAVEAALAAKRISVSRLCRAADVSQTTWQRAKGGNTSGFRAGTTERFRAAFESLTGEPWPAGAPQTEAA
jgi:hypothetical protein